MGLHFAGTVTYTAGAEQQLDLRNIPMTGPNGGILYVKNIFMTTVVPLTSAATSDAIGQKSTPAIVSTLTVLDNLSVPFGLAVPTKGAAFRLMQQMALRAGPNDPAALAANTSTTNTLRVKFNLPFFLPGILRQSTIARQPMARLEGGTIKVGWAASTIYGTGQVIGAVVANVFIEYEEGDALVISPELVYHQSVPVRLDQDPVLVNGKPLYLIGADLSYSGTISSNDYTDQEVRLNGQSWLNRQTIDGFTHLYNEVLSETGDADDAQLALPSSGSAEFLPLIVHTARQDVSKMPDVLNASVTLVAGAGNPAASDLTYIVAALRPKNADHFARSIEKSRLWPNGYERVMRSLTAKPNAMGNRGEIGTRHPQYPYLPVTIHP